MYFCSKKQHQETFAPRNFHSFDLQTGNESNVELLVLKAKISRNFCSSTSRWQVMSNKEKWTHVASQIFNADIQNQQSNKQVISAKLMRRTTALAVPIRRLSWFNYPFWRNSLLKSTPQPQIAKNTNTFILEIQGHSRSSMFTPIKGLSLYCLLW